MPEQAPVQDPIALMGSDTPREKCGIVGVYSPDGGAIPDAFYALKALQHRGQDGSGFSYVETIQNQQTITTIKALGKVAVGFNEAEINAVYEPQLATAHVRYGTTPAEDELQALHPLSMSARGNDYTISHNGEFNMSRLIEIAEERSIQPIGTDTELFAKILQHSIEQRGHIEPALHDLLPQLEGAFNLSILSKDTIYAVRDRQGIRPLVVGNKGKAVMIASETGALNDAGYSHDDDREVMPGTYVAINKSGVREEVWSDPDQKSCIFEYVYLSKSSNVLNGRSVSDYRFNAGEMLARQDTVMSDLIVPVLGSAKIYARGYEQGSSARYTETALAKNPSSGRTFIARTQAERIAAVKEKFIPNPDELDGKIVTLVDDSLVRGTTMRGIIETLRDAGAREVHVRIGSERYLKPCTYGVNVQDEKELLAPGNTPEEMAANINADSLMFISREQMHAALDVTEDEVCDGCMGGSYPEIRPRPSAALA